MRNKKWNRKLRSGLAFFLTLASLAVGCMFPAYAHDGEHGEIQVDVVIEDDNGHDVGIKDVDFVLYYVAAWENNNWSLTLEFDEYKGTIDFTDAKAQEKTANDLYKYVEEKKFKDEEGISNRGGVIEFDNLEPGVYLLIQRYPFQYGDYTYNSAPSVIRLPSNIGDKDYMDVELEPKFTRSGSRPTKPGETDPEETKPSRPDDPTETSPEETQPTKHGGSSGGHHSSSGNSGTPTTPGGSEPNENITVPTDPAGTVPEETIPEETPEEERTPEPERSPKTGDESDIGFYILSMGISLIAMIGLVILIRERKKEEKEYEKKE